MSKKNIERFSDRVEDYVRFRPHYPAAILPFLKEAIGLSEKWTIADIGSGTGISSELFLQNGNTVYAIEPNKDMRLAAEMQLAENKRFISIEGTAESTSLNRSSIDLIVAGQAFHWFDQDASKKEFQRIAKSGAFLLLMWNERSLKTEFQKQYECLLEQFAIDYQGAAKDHVDEEAIEDFFSPAACHFQHFAHSQVFDFNSLKGRLLSSSYAPTADHPHQTPMLQRLKTIFQQLSTDGCIEFAYDCKLFFGKIFN